MFQIQEFTCDANVKKLYVSNAYLTKASFSPGFIVHLENRKKGGNTNKKTIHCLLSFWIITQVQSCNNNTDYIKDIPLLNEDLKGELSDASLYVWLWLSNYDDILIIHDTSILALFFVSHKQQMPMLKHWSQILPKRTACTSSLKFLPYKMLKKLTLNKQLPHQGVLV